MSEDRSSHGEPLRGEHEDDQSERQMSELMTEVRIVMPGVQVLFAFLLTVPFQSSFDEVTDTERVLYVLTLMSSAVASACLIACAALHRVLFGHRERDFIIRTGNRLALAGLVGLASAMSCAIGLVISYIWLVMPKKSPRKSTGNVGCEL